MRGHKNIGGGQRRFPGQWDRGTCGFVRQEERGERGMELGRRATLVT